MGQGSDHPIAGPGDPAGLSRAPEHVIRVEIQYRPARQVLDQDGFVGVQRPLWPARGPAGEVEQGKILGIGRWNISARSRSFQLLVEVEGSGDPGHFPFVPYQENVLQGGEHVAQRRHLAWIERRGGDQDPRQPCREAGANGFRTESREQGTNHAPVLQGPQDGDVKLGTRPE